MTNWFRVPMNVLTCATLLAVNHPTAAADKRIVFCACAVALTLGGAASSAFRKEVEKADEGKKAE